MVRLASRQQQRATRWALPRPFHRTLKAALKSAGVGIAHAPDLRRMVRQILDSSDMRGATREDLVSSLQLALVEAAMELGFSPGPERNELLAKMVAVCQEELYRKD